MDTVLHLLCFLGGGLLLNFFASIFLSRITKTKAALLERVRISSIEDANSVVNWRAKRKFTDEEKLRLWSDAMNIVMTAESKEVASRYLVKASQAMGDQATEFRAQAQQVLDNRFGESTKKPLLEAV